ncbi:MAG: ATP-binding protein [Desulfatibacillaceae bacterium]|nr:ATP-binding protein [Desulfatibacillaceae bacterium]
MISVESIFVDAMRTLAMVLDMDEGEKLNHAWRVGLVSLAVAKEMGLSRPDLVYYGGLLHDIGSVGLLDHVIHHAQHGFKDSEARRHSEKGAHILRPFLPALGLDTMVAEHHERFDGKGFPSGKKEDEISIPAAVIHMADILDVLLRDQPSQVLWEKVFKITKQASGAAVAPAVAQAAASVIERERDWFEDLFEPEGPKTQAMAIHLAPKETASYTPDDLLGQMLWLFTRVIDAKSPAIMGHSIRVAWTASRIAQTLATEDLDPQDLVWAGLLHDVGVMGVPRSLFSSDKTPDSKERLRLNRHAAYSMEVISHMRPVAHLALAAGSHHEHYNGQGYPLRARGEEIPLMGRLLAFSDYYDRLTLPGRPGSLSHEKAMKRLGQEKGRRLDPRLAEAALDVLSSCGQLQAEPPQDLESFRQLFSTDRADVASLVKKEAPAVQVPPDPQLTRVSLLYQSFLLSHEPVAFTDSSDKILDANRAFLELVGLGLDKVAGSFATDLGLDLADSTGAGQTREIAFAGPDGRTVELLVSSQIIRDTAGQSLGRIWHMSDISARRQMEEALKEKNRALAELNRMKSDMLAITSHDMKSPLGGIIGYASMVKELFNDLAPVEILRYLDRIIASGNQLVRFINDILDASRIESGSLELFFDEVDLDSILRLLTDEQLAAHHGREISIRYLAPKNLKPVWADKARITQVLANLLSNAAKFSPIRGEITIEYAISEDGKHIVSVADQGPGIPKENAARIFERYYQVNGNGVAKSQGSGLGLYIVKNLAQAHGGEVAFCNREGGGSVFTLTLPGLLPGTRRE